MAESKKERKVAQHFTPLSMKNVEREREQMKANKINSSFYFSYYPNQHNFSLSLYIYI